MRLITDNKTRRSKGIAYIEFQDTESVPLAMGLNNQKLLGVPIIIQPSQAEKNRMSNPTTLVTKGNTGPMRLYVGSLHFNITEDMLRGIFEPFGKVSMVCTIFENSSNLMACLETILLYRFQFYAVLMIDFSTFGENTLAFRYSILLLYPRIGHFLWSIIII